MATSTLDRRNIPGGTGMRKSTDGFLNYLSVEKGASANTVAAYRNDLQQLADFIGSRPGAKGWQSLDRTTIQDFILHLKERGYTETSVARKVAAVRSFFTFLSAEGMITANPTEGLTSPRVGKSLPRAISPNEVDELLEQPARRSTPEAKRDRAMLELLYATGMRVSELVSLDIENIYLEGKRPFVRCPGRGDDARDVPITRRCYDALVDYLESARPLMARNGAERALFVNTRGGRMT